MNFLAAGLLPLFNLSMEVITGDNSISGTYVHPDLLLDR